MAAPTNPLPTCSSARPDRVWAGDIPFIPTSANWLCLAVVIILCSRKIVGCPLAGHLRADLVIDASSKPWDRAARCPASSSTATAAANTAAALITHADVRTESFASLASYDNTHRKHSSLGSKTPASFEALIHSNN